MSNSLRIAYGCLSPTGARMLPADIEGVDYLLLDGGPLVAPDEPGPELALEQAFRRLAPWLYLDPQLKVIASLAGRDPLLHVTPVAQALVDSGCRDQAITVLRGHDMLDRLEELFQSADLAHAETGQRLVDLKDPIHAASVCLPHVIYPQAINSRVLLVGYSSAEAMTAGVAESIGVEQPLASRVAAALCHANRIPLPPSSGETEVYEAVTAEIDSHGDIAFLGNDYRRQAAEQVFEGAEVEKPRFDALRLEVRHRVGFATKCFVKTSPDIAEELAKLLNSYHIDTRLQQWRSDQSDDALLEVLLQAKSKEDVETHLRRFWQAAWSERSRERGAPAMPSPIAVYETWPTRLPFEEFEILSEKQSAQAWLNEES